LRTGHIWEFIETVPNFNIKAVSLDLLLPTVNDVETLLDQVSDQNRWGDLLDALWDYHREPFKNEWGQRDEVRFIAQKKPLPVPALESTIERKSASSQNRFDLKALLAQYGGWAGGLIGLLLLLGLGSWAIGQIPGNPTITPTSPTGSEIVLLEGTGTTIVETPTPRATATLLRSVETETASKTPTPSRTPTLPPPTETETATKTPTPSRTPTTTPTPTEIAPKGLLGYDDDEWIEIPAGPFYFGAAEGDTDADDGESPADSSFDIPYDYWIAQYETTNAQYKLFIDETGHSTPACIWEGDEIPGGLENHPVVCVSWNDAIVYVDWLNDKLEDSGYEAMLPNEPEWEKAARGAEDDRLYPWGDEFDGTKLNCGETFCPNDGFSGTAPVGSFSTGASSYGVEDMAGNVWEWTRSKDVNYPYDSNDGREALSGDENRVLRGGSWNSDRWFVRVSNRSWNLPGIRADSRGFRVVLVRPPSQ
jgi:formylglycine-generating enzyme required for sulfatase activity